MKTLFNLVFLIFCTSVNAQDERSYEERVAEARQLVNEEASILRDSMESSDEYFLNKELEIDFAVDTFKVESFFRRQVDIDYSTYGMVQASIAATQSYDDLLNKYYQLLLKRLNTEDQEILRIAQRNWLKFRDAEIDLIRTVSMEEYTGGGTMQRIINSGWVFDLTKTRAIDIYQHLLRVWEM